MQPLAAPRALALVALLLVLTSCAGSTPEGAGLDSLTDTRAGADGSGRRDAGSRDVRRDDDGGDGSSTDDGSPADVAPDDTTPTDTSPVDTTPGDTTPVDTTPADTTPGDTSPVDTTPGDTTPDDTTPVDTAPVDTAPVDTTPADTTPEDTTPGDTSPADTTPGDTSPEDTTPGDTSPADTTAGPVSCSPETAAARCGDPALCVDGFCCDTACDSGCGVCNAAGREGICSPVPEGRLCRGSAGLCDLEERCDGQALACPADTLRTAGAVCRPPNGACDVLEICDGRSAVCPPDGFAAAGSPCGDSVESVCDAADSCDGAGTCLPNPRPSSTVCRAASHVCDAEERCDGQGSCPPDGRMPVGSACGDRGDTTCSAPDTCDTTGDCVANHRNDGQVCDAGTTTWRCGGTGCDARPQAQTTPRVCSAGACVNGAAGDWVDLATCSADAICVADGASARCAPCGAPPAGYCDAGNAWNYEGAGACAAGACAWPLDSEACAGGCVVNGNSATCSSCNDNFAALANGPLWSWNTGNEGWSTTGLWSRSTAERRSGSHSMSYYDGWEYGDWRDDRLRWSFSADMTRCTTCAVQVEFWVKGQTEANFDGVTLQCSPNGGSSWTSVGAMVSGSYSSWTRVARTLPASCLTSNMRLGLRFTSDSSWSYAGYHIDDLRLFTTNTAPTGFFDSASATGLGGWTCDGDAWSDELTVRLRFYRNGTGTPIVRTVRASGVRPDLVTANVCGGTGNHGFSWEYDAALIEALGAGTHTVRAWALDGPGPCGAGEYELSGSPKTFTR